MIPQDIEVIKYLKGFLDRNCIPAEKVQHFGWYGNSLDNHIKHLEKDEFTKSKLSSKINVPAKPFIPPTTPQNPAQPQPTTAKQPTFTIPVTPVNECTQGELGLETGEKYTDKFEDELAFLKQDITKAEQDQDISSFVPDIKRKEAINTNEMDLAFLRALQDLSLNKQNSQAPSRQGNPFTPEKNNQEDFAHLRDKTNIFPSGFNPNPSNQSPSQNDNRGFNMSDFGRQPNPDPANFGSFGVREGLNSGLPQPDQKLASLHQVPGWALPGQPAFTPIQDAQDKTSGPSTILPVFPSMPGSHQFPTASGLQPSSKTTMQQPAKPRLSSSEFVTLLRRVGV